VPGNCPDGQTDTENKTPKQQNKTKQNKTKKKKKKKVRAGLGSARKLPGQFTTNRLASSADHI
jgi:hypothetical protein